MPNMISLRSFRLETTTGHVIEFEANVARFVPDAAVPAAMAAGCVPENAEDRPFYEDASRAKMEFQGDLRRSMLYVAVKTIAERNDSKQFDGAGNPKADVVSERLGFEVQRQEVVDAFRVYLQAKAEEREVGLHEATAIITRVIDADGKPELVEVANELGLPADKTKGLSVRDLRKLLLSKFNGAVAA